MMGLVVCASLFALGTLRTTWSLPLSFGRATRVRENGTGGFLSRRRVCVRACVLRRAGVMNSFFFGYYCLAEHGSAISRHGSSAQSGSKLKTQWTVFSDCFIKALRNERRPILGTSIVFFKVGEERGRWRLRAKSAFL